MSSPRPADEPERHGIFYVPRAWLDDPETWGALKRDRDLYAVIFNPCTFCLMTSIEAARQSESAADRKFRIERHKEKRELQRELMSARA